MSISILLQGKHEWPTYGKLGIFPNFFYPMPPHVPYGLRGLLPGCG
jgi:hypothetical protein